MLPLLRPHPLKESSGKELRRPPRRDSGLPVPEASLPLVWVEISHQLLFGLFIELADHATATHPRSLELLLYCSFADYVDPHPCLHQHRIPRQLGCRDIVRSVTLEETLFGADRENPVKHVSQDKEMDKTAERPCLVSSQSLFWHSIDQ